MGFFSKKKTSVLELLNEDLSNIDINSYTFIESEITDYGTEIKTYKKDLKLKELGLFISIEFILFPNGEKNFTLKSDIEKLERSKLKQLVNDLVSFYGYDSSDSGKIENDEIEKIISEKWWLGRTWYNSKPEVSIYLHDSENLTLTILGVQ
jgi:hypothetical protein